MTDTIAFVRRLPWGLGGRLAAALVEVAVAAVILSGSVVIGHSLRDWRAWYGDPATSHPWAPTVAPSTTALAPMTASPAPVPTPALAQRAAVAATPAPACHTSSGRELLVFISPAPLGADCVWLAQQADGTHLVVTTLASTTDLGLVEAAPPAGAKNAGIVTTAQITPYWPAGWQGPVVAVVGPTGSGRATAVVFTWQSHRAMPLLRVSGAEMRVASDTAGWPRVTLTRSDGAKTYVWDGRVFSER